MPSATRTALATTSVSLRLLIRPLAAASHFSRSYVTTPAAPGAPGTLPSSSQQHNALDHPQPNLSPAPLDWNEYFRMRKLRRRFERGFQIPTALAGLGSGGAYFTQIEIDPTQTVLGFDPLFMYAIGTLGCGVAGLLAGPVVGNWVFRATHRKLVSQMDKRDKDFYTHIIKNRADARLNSIRNPVPDYYGEKINSVSEYRSWLRKQREHTRKGMFGGRSDEMDA
ncbi:Pam17-domain-containing protein [Jimgerdemannia flammicorona]|uniref:Presequence translocated-associated motor subunit PAM17 n=2 Tax=Jimgerdemannia flammicorona TaxID=994334 RepID=A0A433Q8N4_9FUNG|nr:Pam17-domain-containing protein [Jimgerdemannia flammicorona]RUS26168.1 Pam17-domain-containing protein [Jimgerdemannia flammicorona]